MHSSYLPKDPGFELTYPRAPAQEQLTRRDQIHCAKPSATALAEAQLPPIVLKPSATTLAEAPPLPLPLPSLTHSCVHSWN